MRTESERRLRVLAADDSAVMREVLRTIFAMHAEAGDSTLPGMELCGVARDGVEALEQVDALRPDVLVLDMEMPRVDGLGVLKGLRGVAPLLPVILCSTYTERGARATLEGLAAGAKDYVTKPEHQKNYGMALDSLTRQLLPKIAALAVRWSVMEKTGFAGKTGFTGKTGVDKETGALRAGRIGQEAGGAGQRVTAVVIGVSTGGPSALETMLPMLPPEFPVPVLIVQHMPRLFTGALSERLNRVCRMPVAEARDGASLGAGRIWIAPGDEHLEVAAGVGRGFALRLRDGEPENGCRPSADVLFRAAARMFGAGTLAVVMTGMGSDGTEGARAVRAAGGWVLAQDETTSAVWGMPARIVEEGLASAVLPLGDLAGALVKRVLAGRGAGRAEVMHGVL